MRYYQPDFRAPATIETAVRPLPPFWSSVRVAETETSISGAEVREIVGALYAMFGVHVRVDHMAPLWALLDHFPGPSERVALRKPLE